METTVDLLEQLRDKFNLFHDLTRREIEGEYPDRHMAITLLADYYARIFDEKEAGKQLAWVNYAVPSEVCWVMGITPVEIDAVSGAAAAARRMAGSRSSALIPLRSRRNLKLA